MPVTTFDIPQELLVTIDNLIHENNARNRREVVVKALEVFFKLQANKWNGPFIYINGIRKGLISKGSLTELISGMSLDELYDSGKRMGKTLRDSAIERRLDLSRPENHITALQMLEDFGWGRFTIDDERITVTSSLLPAALIHGYLETALSIRLTRIETREDIVVLGKLPIMSRSNKVRSKR